MSLTNIPEIDSCLLNFVTIKCLFNLITSSNYNFSIIKLDPLYKILLLTNADINNIHKHSNLKLIKIIYNDPLFEKKINFLYIVAKKSNNSICKCVFSLYKNLYYDKKSILSYSIKKNDTDLFYFYIKNHANIHAKNNKALETAAKFGNFELVKFLVNNGAYVNARKGNIMKYAIISCNVNIVKLLHEKGAIISSRDNYELIIASETGSVEIFAYIAKHCVNVENYINIIFMNACLSLNVDLVKYICSRYLIQQQVLNKGFLNACFRNDLDTINYLHSKNIDINFRETHALYTAITDQYNNLCKWLCTNGANIRHDNCRPIVNAIKVNNLEFLIFVFNYYSDIKNQQTLMNAFLNTCIFTKNTFIFNELYHLCCDEIIKSISCHLIIEAIKHDQYDIIEIILNVNYKNSKNKLYNNLNDPLSVACRFENYNIIKLLLKYYQKGNIPGTALLKACQNNNFKIVDLLLQHGADPNYEVNLPLQIAAENSSFDIVNLLLIYGANVGINSSILHAATVNYDRNVVKLIIKNIKCNQCKKRKRL